MHKVEAMAIDSSDMIWAEEQKGQCLMPYSLMFMYAFMLAAAGQGCTKLDIAWSDGYKNNETKRTAKTMRDTGRLHKKAIARA